uniref:Uncharacterized protein n=1 Tax=Candidatus Methanogaster sp. ANME-2c ERB4 TaxID=2759911 RepID=A0A7G9YQI5_9EURY|nr:hypothetical protein AHGKLJGF_00004 [Methanosarcinales archaeon ANME-2c ERB4]
MLIHANRLCALAARGDGHRYDLVGGISEITVNLWLKVLFATD